MDKGKADAIGKYLRLKEWPAAILQEGDLKKRRNAKKAWRQYCECFLVDSEDTLRYTAKKGRQAGVPRKVVLEGEARDLIEKCHKEEGHFRQNKVQEKLAMRFYWLGMTADIAEVLRRCEECQRQIPIKKGAATLHPVAVKSTVFAQVGVDLVGPLTETSSGNKYIICICDYLSKFVVARPIKSKRAEEVNKVLCMVFQTFGPPDVMITDQGREFVNSLVDGMCEKLGISHRKTSPYHAQSNGLTERFNQTLQTALRKVVSKDQKDWDEHLTQITFGYNTSIHASTKTDPFSVMFARHARLPTEEGKRRILTEDELQNGLVDRAEVLEGIAQRNEGIKERIKEAQSKQKEDYDRRHARPRPYKVGDLVWLANPRVEGRKEKMLDKNLGPYKVEEVYDKGVIKLEGVKKRQNVCKVKPYTSPLSTQKSRSSPTEANDSSSADSSIIDISDSSYHTDQQPWIPELHLTMYHRETFLESDNAWLSDDIIDGSQQILASQFDLEDVEVTCIQPRRGYSTVDPSIKTIQIFHLQNHWVATWALNCAEVFLADSLPRRQLCESLKKMLLEKYYRHKVNQVLTVTSLQLHTQTDASSCGLYAIANVTEVLLGGDPSTCQWSGQREMRNHLIQCLEGHHFTSFPHTHKRTRRQRKVFNILAL